MLDFFLDQLFFHLLHLNSPALQLKAGTNCHIIGIERDKDLFWVSKDASPRVPDSRSPNPFLSFIKVFLHVCLQISNLSANDVQLFGLDGLSIGIGELDGGVVDIAVGG